MTFSHNFGGEKLIKQRSIINTYIYIYNKNQDPIDEENEAKKQRNTQVEMSRLD